MSNVKFVNRVNDGTTSYTVVSLADQRTLGRVTSLQPGVWAAIIATSGTSLGEYPTRGAAGEALATYYRSL